MGNFDHPNVLSMCHAKIVGGGDAALLGMDLAYGDLATLIENSLDDRRSRGYRPHRPFSSVELQSLAYQMLRGLAYLHEEELVLHNDMKVPMTRHRLR